MAYSIEGTQVPDLTGNNTWSGTNKFDGISGNPNLSVTSSSLDDEGYPIATYNVYTAGATAVEGNAAPYTSVTKRATGPSVIIEGPVNSVNANSTEGYPAGLGVAKRLIGDTVYNAVWNDMIDCIEVPEDTELEPGYAYCFDGKNYFKSSKYLEDGFIGIHSDTAGFKMGYQKDKNQFNVGVAGFIIVYIDKEYPVGTPLTSSSNGKLTKLKDEDISENPHKIVATFWKKEPREKWGPKGQEVLVNGRMWVKVKR